MSRIVAEKMNLCYVSSDEIGEKALDKQGGLDKAIKSGAIKEFIRKEGYSLILNEYCSDNFVFDVSGGSISSLEFHEASETLRKTANARSIVVGLLPYHDGSKSIDVLFPREQKREHFKDLDGAILRERVARHYSRLPSLFETFCDIVIYTEDKKPIEVVDEILREIALRKKN